MLLAFFATYVKIKHKTAFNIKYKYKIINNSLVKLIKFLWALMWNLWLSSFFHFHHLSHTYEFFFIRQKVYSYIDKFKLTWVTYLQMIILNLPFKKLISDKWPHIKENNSLWEEVNHNPKHQILMLYLRLPGVSFIPTCLN